MGTVTTVARQVTGFRSFRVAAEIVRVLKPGGLVWCAIPFAYPVHRDPGDYFHVASEGLESMFRGCDVIKLGRILGPFVAIAHFAERAAEATVPARFGFVARWCMAWALHPLKYLDPWIVSRDPDAAPGFFIVARKLGDGPLTSSVQSGDAG